MVFKGLENVPLGAQIKAETFQAYGELLVRLLMWGGFTLITHVLVVFYHQRGTKYLFRVTALLGMICMAFSFGQNDLAKAAYLRLAGVTLWRKGRGAGKLANIASKIPIPLWVLFICGVSIFLAMRKSAV